MYLSSSFYAPLPTPDEMRTWDAAATERFGIPAVLLMENAAQAAFDELGKQLAPRGRSLHPGVTTVVFMGRGNNGGDGAALARILHDEGCRVLLCLCYSHKEKTLPSPAAEHLAYARALGVPVLEEFTEHTPLPKEWEFPEIVIDALYGTGLRGPLRLAQQALVSRINAIKAEASSHRQPVPFVYSLDIPSGLCGLRGIAMPVAIKADATITFEAAKPGLFAPGTEEYTGCVTTRRVGIPFAARQSAPPSWKLIAPRKGDVSTPSSLRHKGTAGKVLIIGGSAVYAGAPALSALGSFGAGAGLVHLAVPESIAPGCRAVCPEAIVHPISESSTTEACAAVTALMESIAPGALVLGPGLGRSEKSRALCASILMHPKRPAAVIDADALFFFAPDGLLASAPDAPPHSTQETNTNALSFSFLRPDDVLTPHPGEMPFLLPKDFFPPGASAQEKTARVQGHRPESARVFSQTSPSVLVLKGAGTIIAQRSRSFALSPCATPVLAVGGSGDVLAGVIAALLAASPAAWEAPKSGNQDFFKADSFDLAALAVHLHATTAEILAANAPLGHRASAIAEALPMAWEHICAKQ